jgi:hypothetical protein
MKCPKCGSVFKADNQAKGGKARWRGMSKGQRKQAASEAAKARWARRQNAPCGGSAVRSTTYKQSSEM